MARVEWDEDGLHVILSDDERDRLICPECEGTGRYGHLPRTYEDSDCHACRGFGIRRTFKPDDTEELYRSVVAEIGPWLAERDAAQAEYIAHVAAGGRLVRDEQGRPVWEWREPE